MKRFYFYLLSLALSGCLNEGGTATSKLELNVDDVNFCGRPYGESFAWNDLQIKNTGKGPLTIKSIKIRGDAGCAFECSYSSGRSIASCVREASSGGTSVSVAEGDSLLVRVVYTPSDEDASDKATLIITTDADNLTDDEEKLAVVKVPVCGRGLPVDTDTAGDAGVPTDGDAGVEACGDCGAPLKKSAPSCTER